MNAIGYFGYAYYEENANELSVVAIANNDTHGVKAGNAVLRDQHRGRR